MGHSLSPGPTNSPAKRHPGKTGSQKRTHKYLEELKKIIRPGQQTDLVDNIHGTLDLWPDEESKHLAIVDGPRQTRPTRRRKQRANDKQPTATQLKLE